MRPNYIPYPITFFFLWILLIVHLDTLIQVGLRTVIGCSLLCFSLLFFFFSSPFLALLKHPFQFYSFSYSRSSLSPLKKSDNLCKTPADIVFISLPFRFSITHLIIPSSSSLLILCLPNLHSSSSPSRPMKKMVWEVLFLLQFLPLISIQKKKEKNKNTCKRKRTLSHFNSNGCRFLHREF